MIKNGKISVQLKSHLNVHGNMIIPILVHEHLMGVVFCVVELECIYLRLSLIGTIKFHRQIYIFHNIEH